MGCPGEGPCGPWDLDLDCCLVTGRLPDPCLGDGTPVDQSIIDAAVLAASQFLWRRTGMQFGCCQVVLRPTCWDNCPNACPGTGFPWTPMLRDDGTWTNVKCVGEDKCTCIDICEIPLPYPVCSVDEVKVNGEVLDPSEYAVFDFKKLVRVKEKKFIPTETNWTLTSVGANIAIPGDQWCFPLSPPDVVNFADPKPGDCWEPNGMGVPDFQFIGLTGFTATYNDPYPNIGFPPGDEGSGVFQIQSTEGTWSWPVNNTPMTVGEKRKSLPIGPNEDYVEITWLGGDATDIGIFYDGITWQRPSGGTFKVEFFTEQLVAGGCWPECNNLTLPDTEEDTWSVKVTYGRPVPELVRMAAAEFACQLIKRCVGKPCDLPQRVQSISRQGVSATFLDPMEFMGQGFTGIFLVDLAIKTYNPKGLYKKAGVYSPDSLNKWRVQTWGEGDPIGPNCT